MIRLVPRLRQLARANPGGSGHTLELDYPPSSRLEPRWGRHSPSHPHLSALIAAHDRDYEASLELIGEYAPALAAIDPGDDASIWSGPYLTGLDSCALYSFLRSRDPALYVEIGSGLSTRFAARAKQDGGLRTQIVSIDPEPRQAIDSLCDLRITQPLEQADLGTFRSLVRGDVVFVDGSHRAFMNSDAVVFLLDVLPDLAPGVLTGIHDIFLPDDYPAEWADRYYSEQYLLAAWLLAQGPRLQPVLASHHVCTTPRLNASWREIWSTIADANGYGSSFWLDVLPAPTDD